MKDTVLFTRPVDLSAVILVADLIRQGYKDVQHRRRKPLDGGYQKLTWKC